jgi:uncharacterized protein (DUF362 family)
MNRRHFLSLGSTAAAWGALATATGCAGPMRNAPNPEFLGLPASGEGRVLLGHYPTAPLQDILAELIPAATDLAWLKPGDSVLLKVACNSANEHPAVTSPAVVRAAIEFFQARTAGRIYVADQAGVGNVRLTPTGRKSSTRACMQANGLAAATVGTRAMLHCFDDGGWSDYFAERADFADHWGEPLYLPKLLQEVDHVVYLPRLGSHALAGYTCGMKIAVGWLRDDSRKTMHQKGASFFEKIAEINHLPTLRSKLRLVLTVADKALLNIGPDFGAVADLGGHMAVVSTNLVDHDYLASNLLRWLDLQQASIFDLFEPYPKHANFFNRQLVDMIWGEEAAAGYEDIATYGMSLNLANDACLSRMAVLQKYRPARIRVERRGTPLPGDLQTFLAGAGSELTFS